MRSKKGGRNCVEAFLAFGMKLYRTLKDPVGTIVLLKSLLCGSEDEKTVNTKLLFMVN